MSPVTPDGSGQGAVAMVSVQENPSESPAPRELAKFIGKLSAAILHGSVSSSSTLSNSASTEAPGEPSGRLRLRDRGHRPSKE